MQSLLELRLGVTRGDGNESIADESFDAGTSYVVPPFSIYGSHNGFEHIC
jgi:hypothetical protein